MVDEHTAASRPDVERPANTSIQISLSDRYQAHDARQGGMGVVIFCEDMLDQCPVALKTWKPELLSRRASRLRFLEEAADWIYLGAHPNIVQAYRVEQMGNPPQPFIVMEHIKSAQQNGVVALSEYLRDLELNPFTPEQALQIALDICLGMRYSTERIKGLVHRDLKPGNILINENGIAKVCDFGLLWTLTEEAIKQRQAVLSRVEDKDYIPAGSTAYIAPEVWQRLNIIDCRADIYALGLMLIEMLTGRQAVDPRDRALAEKAHCTGDLPGLDSSLPQALRALVEKCTALDKQHRFADWADLQQAIIETYEEIADKPPEISLAPEEATDRLSNARSYITIGLSFLDLAYTDVAAPYLLRALEIAQELSDNQLELKARLSLARVFVHEGRLEQAIKKLDAGLAIIEHDPDIKGHDEFHALLGNLYAKRGEIDQAIEVLNKALTRAQTASDEGAEILLLGSLANACAENKRFARAVFYYRAQRVKLALRDDKIGMSTCLANLGAAYLDAGQPDTALPHLHKAAELSEACGNLIGHLHTVKLLCEAYRALEDKASLCEQARRYLTLCQPFNDRDEISWVQGLIQVWGCDSDNAVSENL
jgi:serine/threonine protein kinase